MTVTNEKSKLSFIGGPYHIETETNLFICSANQCTGFYMIGTYTLRQYLVIFSKLKIALRHKTLGTLSLSIYPFLTVTNVSSTLLGIE